MINLIIYSFIILTLSVCLGIVAIDTPQGPFVACAMAFAIIAFLYFKRDVVFANKEKVSPLPAEKPLPSIIEASQLLDIAPLGVMQLDRKGKVLFANPIAALFFGFLSVDELKSEVNRQARGILKFYVNQKRSKDLFRQLYREHRLWVESSEQFYRKNGSVFDATFYLTLRHDKEKEEDFLFVFFEDSTLRLENERKLRASEKRFRDLLDKANAIMIKIDLDGHITYFNEYAQQFFGYESGELLTKHVVGTIVEETPQDRKQIEDIIQDICEHPDEFRLNETRNICRDGRRPWIQWSNKVIRDDHDKVVEILAIGADLTPHKNLEMSLQKQVESERILKDIAHRLVASHTQKPDQVFGQSLEQIKNFFMADCVYVCSLNEQNFVDRFYSSCDKSKERCQKLVDQVFFSRLFWWVDEFENRSFVAFEDCRDMPEVLEPGRKICRDFGVQSIAAVPIFMTGQFIGFVGLAFKQRKLTLDESRMSLLKLCGEVFFNAIHKEMVREKLVEAKERMDLAVHGGNLGMYDWNIESGEIIFNDIWFDMIGFSSRELPHTFETWERLLHPEDRKRVLESIDQYLNGKSSFYNEEFRLKTKSGDWKWIQSQGRLVDRRDEHKATRMIGLQRDITELKMTTRDLARQRDMFQLLIDNMPVGVFVKDARDDFRFVIWNKHMSKIFGILRKDVIGKNDKEVFDLKLANRYFKDDMAVVESREVHDIENETIMTSSGERHAHVIKVPIVDEEKNVMFLLGILEDITEKRQVEQQLRHTQKMHSIGQLAAGVAHEVKNPLAIILLAAEGLLIDQTLAQYQKVQNKVNMIRNSANKANAVVLELLKFSRLSEEDLEVVRVHEVIHQAHFLSKNRDKDKMVAFDFALSDQELFCMGNKILLEQVFINFFNNAIDAIEKDGRIWVTTEFVQRRNEIQIDIKDSGSGIPDSILPKIFDPFFTTKQEGEGTGLGLSTSFTIIEKYKGSVSVDSVVGEGTTFVLRFPAVSATPKDDFYKS